MATVTGPYNTILSAGSLISDNVVNSQGESLGKIEEIMLDVKTGRISYAALSFGGFLGMGDKLFAIPWSALTIDTENEQVLFNVDKDILKDAPGFDKDNWPAMADASWAQSIHKHYGAAPYWQ